MSATSMTAESRELALELYAFLRELDPARFRDELIDSVHAHARRIQTLVADLLRAFAQHTWTPLAPVRDRLEEIQRLLAEHVPSTGADAREHWMRLRTELQPVYESLAQSLRQWDIHVPSLRPTNYARNAFHVTSALVALVVLYAWAHTGPRMLLLTGFFASLAWTFEGTRRMSGRWNDVLMRLFGPTAHPHERHRVNSATWYATALLLLATSGSVLVGAVAVAILGFGDPMAALVGRRYGRVKLVNGRSLEGTLAFAITGFAAAFGMLVAMHPALSTAHAALLAGSAACTGALAELFARRVDDNFAIPAVAGGTVWILGAALGVL